MCLAVLSVVSLVTAVVSIQLLRLGLVHKTVDGQTFQKGTSDAVMLVALTTAACECILCIISRRRAVLTPGECVHCASSRR